MNFQRRRLLEASGVALAGLAGCADLDSDDGRSAGNGGQSSTAGEPLELDFGEGARFSNDSGVALSVELSNPRLLETVSVVRDGEIYVDSPESRPYFLFVTVRVANEGSSAIDPPRGLFFEAEGREVDGAAIRTQGQRYRDIGELAPGEGAEGTIAFPAPDGDGAGTVSLKFQVLLESPPARWTFDFADVPRETADLEKEGLGETATVRAGNHAYEFTPTAVRVTTAYTDGDGNEHTAPSGSTFVLVEARSENVGSEPVKLPNPYDVRLAADGSVYRGGQYKDAAERYEGQVDPYPPGESQAGVFLFDVPDAASSLTLQLAIGNQTFVTWPAEPGGG
ncbi:DUF4352 domain-containing protein [Haloarcula salinisoli]|uniref:DUF4352 domain-containing protein n=1 Tax=Haloarcula salinisoli TaxID=2487746 RepID=A0A8J7YEQ8_9EURY|nr:DUF4352 domain-containing protein [Halomicroarcula salinisoli]MBX0287786.1 DUF4352 domain-containing protein [Halomicroarcula salinisoli]MBX0304710.1 DUF4352 domain-containing protein [Halomicroarcula salinisoli]